MREEKFLDELKQVKFKQQLSFKLKVGESKLATLAKPMLNTAK